MSSERTILDFGIRLRVVYKNDPELIRQLVVYREFVDSAGIYPNPKKIYHRSYNPLPATARDEYDENTESIIKLLIQNNIKPYLILDYTDLDPFIVDTYKDSGLRQYLKQLINSAGLKNISIFNLPLAILLKKDFPGVNLEISENAAVDGEGKAKCWFEVVDAGGLCVHNRINKKTGILKRLKAKTGLKLSAVVNNCCLINCPSEVSHKNMGPYMEEFSSFFDCRAAMAEMPWKAFSQGYIVPANIAQYKGIIDTAVISGAGLTREEVMSLVVHYSKNIGSYEYGPVCRKNELPFYHPYTINREPQEVFAEINKCRDDCDSCGYCRDAWKRYPGIPAGIENCLKGYGYFKKGNYKSAVRAFGDYINSAGCRLDSDICFHIGASYRNIKEDDKALKYFNEAARLNPGDKRGPDAAQELVNESRREK